MYGILLNSALSFSVTVLTIAPPIAFSISFLILFLKRPIRIFNNQAAPPESLILKLLRFVFAAGIRT